MLTVLGGLAEFERELIRARTGEGRERAKARGQGSVSACASWRIPVVMGYAPGCFRGMKRDAVPGMSINGGQASV